MPLVSQNHALYLYQLIQQTIGEGCQVSLANIEAVLAEDNLAPADFNCDDVLSLMQAVPAFIKVTTFKKGRVFVTLMPYPEFDQALEALNQDTSAEKNTDKLKPWRRKRRAKLLRPQKPKHKEPEVVIETDNEKDTSEAEQLTTKSEQATAEVEQRASADEQEINVIEVEQLTCEVKQEAEPTTIATTMPTDMSTTEPTTMVTTTPTMQTQQTPVKTRGIDELKQAIQQQTDSNLSNDSSTNSKHEEEPAKSSIEEAIEKKASAVTQRPQEKKSQESSSQEATHEHNSQATATHEHSSQATHEHSSQEFSSREPAQRTRSNQTQRTRQAYRMEPSGPVRHYRRPSRPEAYIPIALQSNLPKTFQDDIYCPTNILNELYNLAPENTNVMELLAHSWQLARSEGNLSGTRSRVNFPLALEYGCDRKHAPSIVAVIQKTLPITQQKPWIISKLIVQKTQSTANEKIAADAMGAADTASDLPAVPNKRRSPQAVLNEPLFCASDQLVEQADIEHPFNGALQTLTQFALLGSWHTLASELNDLCGSQGGAQSALQNAEQDDAQNTARRWTAQSACNYLASIFYRAYTSSPESLVQTSTKALLHTNLYTPFDEDIYMCFNHLEEPEDEALASAADTAEGADQATANEDSLDACIVTNRPPRAETPSWSFAGFSTSDGDFVTKAVEAAVEDSVAQALTLPMPVSFAISTHALYFDANAKLTIDTHQLRNMLPAEIQQNISQGDFLEACQQAFTRAKRNYRYIAQGYSSVLNEVAAIIALTVPTTTPYALVLAYMNTHYQLANVVECSVAQQSAYVLSQTPAMWLAEKTNVAEVRA